MARTPPILAAAAGRVAGVDDAGEQLPPDDVPDEDVDRLFGLPLGAFVPERGALAKRLRADGHRDAAAWVGHLPRPSVAAWATNQVVRSQGPQARDLWQAADDLAGAQAELIAGRAAREDLRDPLARMRAALEQLTGAALGLVDDHGRDLSATTIQRVGETLMAAATDPGVRAAVAAGRAVREASPAGFGLGGGPAPGPEAPVKRGGAKRKVTKKAGAEAAAAKKAERERRAAARRAAKAELAEARAARAAAERALAAANQALGQAEHTLDDARAREEAAARALEDAG
jgi:hypothetical protein